MIIWLTGQPGSGKTTLASKTIEKIRASNPALSIIHLDGDDLRNINKNKDYSKAGRIQNISTAISIIRFLSNKNFLSVISIVSPYAYLRDELKSEFTFLEVYLHTSEIRGREDFFASDYEVPTDPKTLFLDTGKLNIENCVDKIYSVFERQFL